VSPRRGALASLTLLVVIAFAAGGLADVAWAQTGPCHGCGGYNLGGQTVYGGEFRVRVKPPPGRGQGGGPAASSGVADCSAIPPPATPPLAGLPAYRWPLRPMPCSLLTFAYFWNQGLTCPDPAALSYTEIIAYPPFGSWVPPGRFLLCLTAADFQAAGVAPPPGLLAIAVWRQMPFPNPRIEAKPALKGLVNLPSYFWLRGPAAQTRSVPVGPYVVSVTAAIVDYTWSWGDQTPDLSTNDPGTPWPGRSSVNHAYLRRGQFPVTVTTRWHGTFTVNNGPPQDVIGPDIFRASAVAYGVQELTVTLTQ